MDGEIVYEVRLDGSKIASDLAAIEDRLSRESPSLAEKFAAAIGQSAAAAGALYAAQQAAANAGTVNAQSGQSTTIVWNRTMAPMSSGSGFIPSDNFPALLHKGEAVLTAPQNIRLQAAGGIGALEKRAVNSATIENKINLPENLVKQQEPVINLHVDIGGTEIARVIADATNARNKQLGVRKK
jgi:hypothetical protein